MNKKKVLGKVVLIVGLLPFTVALGFGIFSAITGFSGLCILNCKEQYGLQAFIDSVIMYSYIFWPTYLVGIFLVVLWAIKFVFQKRADSIKNNN